MRAINFLQMIIILTLLSLTGCDSSDDEDVVPVFLIDFNEYAPASKPFSSEDVKGYVEEYGLNDLAALVKYDIKVYKVNYKTAFEGDTITASGLIAVPVQTGKSDAFPMLSYQHGTITSDSQSPTTNPQGESTALAIYIASTGFIVMIPDYIGYGSSSNLFHPFMVKQYTVNAVLDFIRATKEFIATEKPCKTNNKLFLSGYSEGGSATLAALGAIEGDSRNSGLKVTASACGAGIYDLNSFRSWMVSQAKYDQPYFVAYLLESYKRYAKLDIADSLVFSNDFAHLIPDMIDGTRSSVQMNEMFGTLHVGELFNDNFEQPDTIFKYDENYSGLRVAFTENTVKAWNLKSNVTLYYGKSDMWVPSEQSLKIYLDFRSQGAISKINIDAMNGLDHNGAVIPTLTRSISWFRSF